MLLALALLVLIWERRATIERSGAAVVAALMPIGGAAIYSAFIYRLTGDPLAWFAGQTAWGRASRGLGDTLWSHARLMMTRGVDGYVQAAPISLLNALAVLLSLGAVVPVARRWSMSYAVFILLNLVPPLLMDGLMSTGRFTAVLFPVFLWLAMALGPSLRTASIVAFAVLQGLTATIFYTWRPMF